MKNLTTKEKLQELFKYMKDAYANVDIGDAFLFSFFQKQLRNELFGKLVKLSGYDNLPTIVPDEQYKKMNGFDFNYMSINIRGNEAYCGARDINHHANLLFDETYHFGTGDVSNGLYASINNEIALNYTADLKNTELVLKLKMPDMKIIDDLSISIDLTKIVNGQKATCLSHEKILLEIKEFFESIEDESERAKFANLFFEDLGLVAILLGYDALYDHHFPAFAMFNRSKIYVSESEYKRIAEKTGRTFTFSQSQKD